MFYGFRKNYRHLYFVVEKQSTEAERKNKTMKDLSTIVNRSFVCCIE